MCQQGSGVDSATLFTEDQGLAMMQHLRHCCPTYKSPEFKARAGGARSRFVNY